MDRQILHIDMNAFYCSCHEAESPALYRGKPTAVAGSPETRHGVVVTASYEARRRGVKATMTVPEAARICPDIIFITPNFELYRAYSKAAFDIVRNYTPQVEIFSIDECWADITGSSQFGTSMEIAAVIQQRLLEELGLPCSIGVGPNKFLTKMASDFKKPLGITELWLTDVQDKLWPLPVQTMFGVGGSTRERLERMGIRTIGDLAEAKVDRLTRSFGKRTADLIQHANGIDNAVVEAVPEPLKSVGHSITLSKDVHDIDELSTVLLNLSDQVGRRLRHHDRIGKTVQLTVRFADRKTITRARTLSEYTDLTEQIYTTAVALLKENKPVHSRVRLLGVAVSGLCSRDDHHPDKPQVAEQMTLFDFSTEVRSRAERGEQTGARPPLTPPPQKLRALTQVTDQLRNKYGENIVVRGRMLQKHQSDEIRDHQKRGTSLQKDKLH